MRVDLYTAVHKAQRFHLFHLSDEIGRADFSDSSTVGRIAAVGHRLLDHLRDHAENEEKYIHPLFKELGNAVESLDNEHRFLGAAIQGLDTILTGERWEDLYSAYRSFLAAYLSHLDEEEEAQAAILWPAYSDDDLLSVFARFQTERSAEHRRDDLEFMLPALSISELRRMFLGMKAAAPATAFSSACELASRILENARWEQLRIAVE